MSDDPLKIRLPFHNLEPTFFAGLLDDPILLLRTRSSGRNLLFDCGQIHHLAKRIFTPLDAVFVSHAHMDHWMGIDAVIRHLIVANRTIDLFGPAGLADRMEHKLNGYDWNLMEDYWCSFRVHEIHDDHIRRSFFPGPEGFRRHAEEPLARVDQTIYRTPQLEVRAVICDHRLDSLIFRIQERPAYLIDRDKLAGLGLSPGPWLGELQKYHLADGAVPASRKLYQKAEQALQVADPDALLQALIKPQPGLSIGYVSDIGFTAENRERIIALLEGVDLLACECTYLSAEQERARVASHLCVTDVNLLLQDLRPAFFVPMHLSRTYSRRSRDLYRELNPPPETRLLELPLQVTPRPLQAAEIDWRAYQQDLPDR